MAERFADSNREECIATEIYNVMESRLGDGGENSGATRRAMSQAAMQAAFSLRTKTILIAGLVLRAVLPAAIANASLDDRMTAFLRDLEDDIDTSALLPSIGSRTGRDMSSTQANASTDDLTIVVSDDTLPKPSGVSVSSTHQAAAEPSHSALGVVPVAQSTQRSLPLAAATEKGQPGTDFRTNAEGGRKRPAGSDASDSREVPAAAARQAPNLQRGSQLSKLVCRPTLLHHLLLSLSYRDACSVAGSCRALCGPSSSNPVWVRMVARDFFRGSYPEPCEGWSNSSSSSSFSYGGSNGDDAHATKDGMEKESEGGSFHGWSSSCFTSAVDPEAGLGALHDGDGDGDDDAGDTEPKIAATPLAVSSQSQGHYSSRTLPEAGAAQQVPGAVAAQDLPAPDQSTGASTIAPSASTSSSSSSSKSFAATGKTGLEPVLAVSSGAHQPTKIGSSSHTISAAKTGG